MSTSQELIVERDGRGVVTLTLNRPDKRNALSATLIAALTQALTDIAQDPLVRVVVLTGAGAAFCGGADIAEMRAAGDTSIADNQADAMRLAKMLVALETLPQPTLALVNGAAFGGAVGLIGACDIAIATEPARFALSEVRLGLIPAMISPYVVRAIGTRQASRWFLTGEAMPATTALAIGLVHEVTGTEGLKGRGEEMITALLAGGPLAQAEAKRQLRKLFGRSDASDFDERAHSTALIARLRASVEGREGLAAFLEKRSPAWTGKR